MLPGADPEAMGPQLLPETAQKCFRLKDPSACAKQTNTKETVCYQPLTGVTRACRP